MRRRTSHEFIKSAYPGGTLFDAHGEKIIRMHDQVVRGGKASVGQAVPHLLVVVRTMKKSSIIVVLVSLVGVFIFAAIAFGGGQRSKEITGSFFRLTTKLEYKGTLVEISYSIGCHVIGSRQMDGDRSVDGTSLTPFLFGKKMHDGGVLVVQTPNFCNPSWSTDTGKVPASFNPMIIYFEDGERPWFGTAYIEREAYDSPLSVMKFLGSRVDRISGSDWQNWRQRNLNSNWVTWDKIGLNPDWFAKLVWTPGMRKMPMVCHAASVLRLPEEVRSSIRKWWPSDKPFLWHSYEGMKEYTKLEGSRRKLTLTQSPDLMFDGFPAWEYDRTLTSPKRPRYPATTDFSMNDLLADGTVAHEKIARGKAIDLPNGRPSYALTRNDVLWDKDHRGFGFCNEATRVENYDQAFGDLGGLYKVNGKVLIGAELNDSRRRISGGFINDEYVIGFGENDLYTMGGGL